MLSCSPDPTTNFKTTNLNFQNYILAHKCKSFESIFLSSSFNFLVTLSNMMHCFFLFHMKFRIFFNNMFSLHFFKKNFESYFIKFLAILFVLFRRSLFFSELIRFVEASLENSGFVVSELVARKILIRDHTYITSVKRLVWLGF